MQDTALSPSYEALLEPDSNMRSTVQTAILKILSGLNRTRTPEGYVTYQLDQLDQDELYTIQIRDFRGPGDIVPVSDQFFLGNCSYIVIVSS